MAQKGQSLVMWTVTFGIVVAAMVFIRMPFKRGLQGKIMAAADYCFWSVWDKPVEQYKGDLTSFVKSKTAQDQEMIVHEQKREQQQATIKNFINSSVQEDSAFTAVEDGAESYLKTFDLNTIVE